MRKIATYLAAMSLLLVACGGSTPVSTAEASDDSDSGPAPTSETTETEETTDASETDEDVMADEADDGVDDSTDTKDDPTTVSSIDDIPQVCQDLMADFLRDIEPIVSPIDWDNATMADFEQVGTDFEPIADKFDADSEATGQCDDIDMDEDGSLDILVEFAEQEAAGTVGFLTFLSSFMDAVVGPVTGSGDAAFSTCDDAIDFIDGLMNDYESSADVPMSDLTAMAGIAGVMLTCTPEQQAYFTSPEVTAYLEGMAG